MPTARSELAARPAPRAFAERPRPGTSASAPTAVAPSRARRPIERGARSAARFGLEFRRAPTCSARQAVLDQGKTPRTGSRDGVRTKTIVLHSMVGLTKSIRLNRASKDSSATLASRRARRWATQKWTPCPNATDAPVPVFGTSRYSIELVGIGETWPRRGWRTRG